MKKYKIGNKVVYANSLHDALEIYKHKVKDSTFIFGGLDPITNEDKKYFKGIGLTFVSQSKDGPGYEYVFKGSRSAIMKYVNEQELDKEEYEIKDSNVKDKEEEFKPGDKIRYHAFGFSGWQAGIVIAKKETRYGTRYDLKLSGGFEKDGIPGEYLEKIRDSKVKDYKKADVQKIADYLWSWSDNDPSGWEARYIVEEGLNESNLTEANIQKGINNAEKELDNVYAQLKQKVQQMLEAGYKGQKERIYKYADVLRKEDAYQV